MTGQKNGKTVMGLSLKNTFAENKAALRTAGAGFILTLSGMFNSNDATAQTLASTKDNTPPDKEDPKTVDPQVHSVEGRGYDIARATASGASNHDVIVVLVPGDHEKALEETTNGLRGLMFMGYERVGIVKGDTEKVEIYGIGTELYNSTPDYADADWVHEKVKAAYDEYIKKVVDLSPKYDLNKN